MDRFGGEKFRRLVHEFFGDPSERKSGATAGRVRSHEPATSAEGAAAATPAH
jgi:hypothetical protein